MKLLGHWLGNIPTSPLYNVSRVVAKGLREAREKVACRIPSSIACRSFSWELRGLR